MLELAALSTLCYLEFQIGYVCENEAPCPIDQTCTDSCTFPGYECQMTKIGESISTDLTMKQAII